MKTGKRNNALLNYNLLTEEMIFDNNGRKLAVGWYEIPLIDTVFIKDRKFVALNGKIVEFIYHSKWDLYIEHKCKTEEPGTSTGYGGTNRTGAARSLSMILIDGGVAYDLELPEGYRTKPYFIYWLKKNGELYEFVNMRELKKIYKDQKDLSKEYLKTNNVKFQDQKSIIQFIEYLESK